MLGILLVIRVSSAQVEVCPGALSLAEWDEAMDGVDDALIALDGALASRILDDLVIELPCLQVPAPPSSLGRLARQIALVAFYSQDYDELSVWTLLARETLGDAPWPAKVPVPERFFALSLAVEGPVIDRAQGSLRIPKGGALLLDGFLLRAPEASEIQHLLQVADRRGEILFTDWQNGADFPGEWLTDSADPISVPDWYSAPPQPEPEPSVPEPSVPEPSVPEPVAAPPEEPVLRFDGGQASACPWKNEPNVVIANGREVRVNRHTYPMRTSAEQDAFKAVLRSCGELRAVRRFVRWQAAKDKLFGGIFAKVTRYRESMITALVQDEPGPAPKKKSGG